MPRIYIKKPTKIRITTQFNFYCPICKETFELMCPMRSEYGCGLDSKGIGDWKIGHFSKKHNIDLPSGDFTGKFTYKEKESK